MFLLCVFVHRAVSPVVQDLPPDVRSDGLGLTHQWSR